MTNIQPRTALWWNFAFLVLTGIAAGTVDFAGLSDAVAGMIKTYSSNAAWIIACANIVFHLYSAPTAGPMAKGV